MKRRSGPAPIWWVVGYTVLTRASHSSGILHPRDDSGKRPPFSRRHWLRRIRIAKLRRNGVALFLFAPLCYLECDPAHLLPTHLGLRLGPLAVLSGLMVVMAELRVAAAVRM